MSFRATCNGARESPLGAQYTTLPHCTADGLRSDGGSNARSGRAKQRSLLCPLSENRRPIPSKVPCGCFWRHLLAPKGGKYSACTFCGNKSRLDRLRLGKPQTSLLLRSVCTIFVSDKLRFGRALFRHNRTEFALTYLSKIRRICQPKKASTWR